MREHSPKICEICGGNHSTEEHIRSIEGEIKQKEKAPLVNAFEIITRLDNTPSTQETIDIVDNPVDVWLKNSKDKWLKKTIREEAESHKAAGLDDLYSQAILKSMYGSLEQESAGRFKGQTSEQILKSMWQGPEHEIYGYKRIWAKNLSSSEAETIYVNAVKDAHNLLAEIEKMDLSEVVIDKRLIKLLHHRENLYGVARVLFDWEQVNETNLDEFHHGDHNLSQVLANIDAIGKKIMEGVDRSQVFPEDERLYRAYVKNAWHAVDGDWWMKPAEWKLEEFAKKMGMDDSFRTD